jgi:hypothetical protein
VLSEQPKSGGKSTKYESFDIVDSARGTGLLEFEYFLERVELPLLPCQPSLMLR